MKISDEEALATTKAWASEWIKSRPKDVRTWVLENADEFRIPIEYGLDAAGFLDYIRLKLKADRSATFCKVLLKELKQKLATKVAKPSSEDGQ